MACGPRLVPWPRAPWCLRPVRGRGRSRPPPASTFRSARAADDRRPRARFRGCRAAHARHRCRLVVLLPPREDGVLMGMAGNDEAILRHGGGRAWIDDVAGSAGGGGLPAGARGWRSAAAGRPVRDDARPTSGHRPAGHRGLWIAAGFSGHGFQQGPVVGKLVAEMVVEGAARTVDVTAVRLDRFATGDLSSRASSSECRERGSNPHAFGHGILSPARLPVPPSRPGRDSVQAGEGPVGRNCPSGATRPIVRRRVRPGGP